MRKLFKRAISFFLVPFTQWYLRKERSFRYKDISLAVMPGVFHPGLFYSTEFLLEYLKDYDVENKTFLELGCGSALISIVCAKRGAIVTASDINPSAVENARRNMKSNDVSITILQSDLFKSIPKQTFDIIIINPPYYAGDPIDDAQYAWYCGRNFEYFHGLFETIPSFIHKDSNIIMVLTKGSDINTIKQIAAGRNISFELVREKNVLFDEKDYIFKLITK